MHAGKQAAASLSHLRAFACENGHATRAPGTLGAGATADFVAQSKLLLAVSVCRFLAELESPVAHAHAQTNTQLTAVTAGGQGSLA